MITSQKKQNVWSRTGSAFSTAYMYSTAVVLTVTALAKWGTVIHGGRILTVPDPLWGMSNGLTMACAAAVETAAFALIFRTRDRWVAALAGTVLGAEFLAYRTTLVHGNLSHGCPCLGKLGAWLPISDQHLAKALWWIAAWLFAGGVFAMAYSWRRLKAPPAPLGADICNGPAEIETT